LTAYPHEHGTISLTYTAENQLASAETSKGKVAYQYDGDGNLTVRKAGAAKTTFVPDPQADIWRPLLASDDAGKQTFYLWDGDVPLASMTGAETEFFLHNHLGSVRGVADLEGNVTQSRDYCPFGVPQASVPSGLRPGFSGLFYDAAAGLYLTRARGYDPAMGRFLQTDPQHRLPTGSQKDFSAYCYGIIPLTNPEKKPNISTVSS
jgi:RHS repeat-associated protein